MKIEILGCSGAPGINHRPTAFLIDGELLVDAGTATEVLTPERCAGIKCIVLTHSHLDHVTNLAYLASVTHDMLNEPIRVYGTAETLDALRSFLLNDVIWPDFERIPTSREAKMTFNPIRPLEPFTLGSYVVTPVPVNHTVPTVGYLIDDGSGVIAFLGDTHSTELFWDKIRDERRLRALFIEASFPNRRAEIARISGHLTPELVERELGKLGRNDIGIYITHIMPGHRDEVIAELEELSARVKLNIIEDGMVLDL